MMTQAEVVVHGIAGKPVELPLAAGPPTGYVWTLDLPSGVRQIEDAPGNAVKPEEHLGSSTGGTFRVVAESGHYRITARLARPWDKSDPIRSVVIDLLIK
ncbi:MAG: protease inhibitor I42 family protein [Janthinobacterium lividum]